MKKPELLLLCCNNFEITNKTIYVTVGVLGRTSSVPNSAHRLNGDKAQGLRSGLLTYTSLVLHQINVETRVKAFMYLFTKPERSLIFSALKKTCLLKF